MSLDAGGGRLGDASGLLGDRSVGVDAGGAPREPRGPSRTPPRHRRPSQRAEGQLTSYADQAYVDRLEGHITTDLWASKTAEWEREREDIDGQLASLGTAKTNYLVSGVKLLELAQRACQMYVAQPPHEQRQLLNVVVSNCRLNGGPIEYDFRKPLDVLAEASESNDWRRARDSNPWYPRGYT